MVFRFWVPCFDVHYDFRIKTMFGSSLLQVVCRKAHVLFTLFVFVCVCWCPMHIVLWFCFICLRLVYPILLYLSSSCVSYFALFVFVLCTLFCFVCLRLVYPILLYLSSSCVSYFACFSGLSLRYSLTCIDYFSIKRKLVYIFLICAK
jgi:hypothetical protein